MEKNTSCGNIAYYADTIYVAPNIVVVADYIATMPYKTEGVLINGVNYCAYSKKAPHTCSYKWTSDSTHHWQICNGCDYVGAKTAHNYSNSNDATCNTCGYTRQVQTTTTKPTTTKPSATKPSTTTPNVTNHPVSSTTTGDETTVVDTTISPDKSTTLDEKTSPDTTEPDVTVPDTTDGGKGSGEKDDGNTTMILIVAVASVVATAGIASAVFAVILKKRK